MAAKIRVGIYLGRPIRQARDSTLAGRSVTVARRIGRGDPVGEPSGQAAVAVGPGSGLGPRRAEAAPDLEEAALRYWPPAARRMNEVLAGRDLFSDGPVDDDRWLRIIFGEAEFQPAFSVQMVNNAKLLTAELTAKLGWDEPGYESAKAETARLSPKTHRAEAAARHLPVLWQIISDGPKHTDDQH